MDSNWCYSPETLNSGQNRHFFVLSDLEIWRMTLKNNRAPLLSNIKLCASFHRHIWIQTGVMVRKRLSWVLTSVTLTFDLWLWPFAWTSLLSKVITPENVLMIRCQEHSEKGIERSVLRAAWSQPKIWNSVQINLSSTLNFYRKYFFDAMISNEKLTSEIDAIWRNLLHANDYTCHRVMTHSLHVC